MASHRLRTLTSRFLSLCSRSRGSQILADLLPASTCLRQSSQARGYSMKMAPMWLERPFFTLRAFSAAAPPGVMEMEMPALSPTMSHGNIVEWQKKEGDRLQPGDAIALVETDKATITWEAQEEGYLARILVPAGTRDIEVGSPVALMVEEESQLAEASKYEVGAKAAGGTPAAATPSPAAAAAPSAKSASSFPPHAPLNFPALSPTMSTGNILEWNVKEGQHIGPGDVLCSVETDKSTLDWESQEEGFVAKILVPGGTSNIEVGAPCAILVDEEGLIPAFASFTAADAESTETTQEATSPPAAAPTPTPVSPPPSTPAKPVAAQQMSPAASGGRVHASPYARKLARESGLSLVGVAGSGPGGRIVAADIAQLRVSGKAAPVAPGQAYVDIPHTQVRRIVASRLLESKQIAPHFYVTVECGVDNLVKMRKEMNAALESSNFGTKLSVNDFVVKAAALALRSVPEANSSWFDDFVRQHNVVDINIAVQTPHGLMIPIVRNADDKGLSDISGDIKSLAKKAKEGTLSPEDSIGGTFTISNLGMYGVRDFCAIINPPQSAILAVGGAFPKVISENGAFKEAHGMNCTLSCDHRVVDGAAAAEWLNAFRKNIEQPLLMVV